jgi:hypothetical protein
MPKNRQLVRITARFCLVAVREANKVENKRVYDLVRQVELFIDQHSDKKGIGTYNESIRS